MGERGPGKMPTKLKVLHGETRKGRLNEHEPQGKGRPTMPSGMTPGARSVWRRVMRNFGHTGVITDTDRDILQIYCESVDRYNDAKRRYIEMGALVPGARNGDLIKNPIHQILRDNEMVVRAFARELGLTPSARAGIEISENTEDALERWQSGASS